MAGLDLGKRIADLLAQLRSPQETVRRNAYTTMQKQSRLLHGNLSPEEVQAITEAFASESNPELQTLALSTLLSIALMPEILTQEFPTAEERQAGCHDEEIAAISPETELSRNDSLGTWLWSSFRDPSAVFAVYDAELTRRDEPAEIILGRRLAFESNPATDFRHFSARDSRAHLDIQEGKYKSLCIVGRPGLFGDLFQRWIRCPNPYSGEVGADEEATRFRFTVHQRPEKLPRNEIDSSYHFLVERCGDGKEVRFETTDDGGQRRDYGLIQRYSIQLGDQRLIVVVVAGCSSLGTLGAAHWAARSLFPTERVIAEVAPPPITKEQKEAANLLEALVAVTADSTTGAWGTPTVRLERLYLDAQLWVSDDRGRRWIVAPPAEITLVQRHGTTTALLFDRKPAACKPDHMMFDITVILAEAVHRGQPTLTIKGLQKLLNDRSHSGDEKSITEAKVREQLSTLRNRYLSEALQIDKQSVRITAEVRVIDDIGIEDRR